MTDRPVLADRARPDEADLEQLFRLAGDPPQLPDDEVELVRSEVHGAWRAANRRRRIRRQAVWMTVAASLVAVGAIGLWRSTRPPVGRFEMIQGDVFLGPEAGPAVPSMGIVRGSRIVTGSSGRAALRLASGSSVRLDFSSSLVLDSDTAMTLERGAVYIDSGSGPAAGKSVEVSTHLGNAYDIGTQFEVRLQPAGADSDAVLRVSVREGRVLIRRGGEEHEASTGAALTLDALGSAQTVASAVHGDHWDWVVATAPPITIEGGDLRRFLEWASRELGRPWRFADPALKRQAEAILVHGSIEGKTIDEALTAVLASCGYRFRYEEQGLVIEVVGPPRK